jgi:hypothetical protein
MDWIRSFVLVSAIQSRFGYLFLIVAGKDVDETKQIFVFDWLNMDENAFKIACKGSFRKFAS